ncbi:MAG TPA: ribonuclease III [Egibacteraceae bacterium]|nr:ribonuclease III [Egibacteraceae bacterium]
MSDTSDLGTVEEGLGLTFQDKRLLERALIHRSYAFEAGGLPTNERLEFLGDAVLGLVVTDTIYRALPDAEEGRLAKIRASAVNTRSLADIARGLGLGEQVRLGRGEEQSGGRDKDSILADTMEAVIGALYIDQGLEAAAALIDRLFYALLQELATWRGSLDFKTSLQELTAGELATLPVYRLTEEGPDHAKRFTAQVEVDGAVLGHGTGRSKKEAEQGAAEEAYASLSERLTISSRTVGSEVGSEEDGGHR